MKKKKTRQRGNLKSEMDFKDVSTNQNMWTLFLIPG